MRNVTLGKVIDVRVFGGAAVPAANVVETNFIEQIGQEGFIENDFVTGRILEIDGGLRI